MPAIIALISYPALGKNYDSDMIPCQAITWHGCRKNRVALQRTAAAITTAAKAPVNAYETPSLDEAPGNGSTGELDATGVAVAEATVAAAVALLPPLPDAIVTDFGPTMLTSLVE